MPLLGWIAAASSDLWDLGFRALGFGQKAENTYLYDACMRQLHASNIH